MVWRMNLLGGDRCKVYDYRLDKTAFEVAVQNLVLIILEVH